MEKVVIVNPNDVRYSSAIGCDVHRDNVVCCSLRLNSAGQWEQTREVFPTTYNSLESFTNWCQKFKPNVILMESTGTYWMTPYDALEQANLPISIVNPAHVKRMDGRKTDQEDARWLSQIAVNGSFIPSYIPSMEFRHLRMAARNLCKQIESLSDLKNRETKAFVVAGFRLNVFSDQFGKLATLAKNSLLEGKTGEEVVDILLSQKGSKRLKASKTELLEALSGKLTPELKGMIESNRRIY